MRSHRIPVLLGAVSLLGVAACNADESTKIVPGQVALSQGDAAGTPISGTCETVFAPPTLPPPPVIRQVDQGTCRFSHLGKTSAYFVQDIDVIAGTQHSVEITLTAANGDILRASTEGTNTPNGSGVSFQATMTFTGGTGRFANATGQAQVNGAANFQTNTASLNVEGTISYGRSVTGK